MKIAIWAGAFALIPFCPLSAVAQSVPVAIASEGLDSKPEPQALATAREIIRVGFPEDKRLAMFSGAIDAMTSQMRATMMGELNNDPGAKAIVDGKIDAFIAIGKTVLAQHIPGFMDAYAQGYSREFSQAELTDILGFVKTPAGTHFLSRSSAIIADPAFAAANQSYMRDLQPHIQQMQRELMAELTDYLIKNPPKPAKTS